MDLRRLARLTSLAAMLAVPFAACQAQTLSEYLSLRKKHGITRAVGVEAMESFVGAKIMEVQGFVKGSFSMGGKTTYLVERPDGGTLDVLTSKPSEWLGNGDVAARLIVRGIRDSETGPLRNELLGAAPEAEVARIEWASRPKVNDVRIITPPKPGVKSPLYGPIGSPSKAVAPPRNWNLPTDQAMPLYAGFIKKYNKKLTDSQAIEIARGIIGYSIRFGVDARLIMAMVLVESSFNPNDTSRSGAMGLGQLMPGTAAGLGITNAYDTMQNLYGTARLVRGHIDKYSKKTGNSFDGLVWALAAYNAGSGNVRKYNGPPPFTQTQNYIKKVISTYRAFCGL